MPIKYYSSERGQALVLIMVATVVLLGFTALAVDGSMVYADRRFAQNAADAASLAGGGAAALSLENNDVFKDDWDCSSNVINNVVVPDAVAAAISRAGDNDFTDVDNDVGDDHGVVTQCGVDAVGGSTDEYLDIKTNITLDTQTAFAHFVFAGVMRNTVETVTRVRPRRPLAMGNAIVALNKEGDCSSVGDGTGFHGNTTINLDGGGVWSNGCVVAKDAAMTVTVTDGGVSYGSELNLHDPSPFILDPGVSPQQSPDIMEPDEYDIDPPDCTQTPNYGSPQDFNNVSGFVPAGNYSRITMNGDVTLEGGGLYCMTGLFDTGNVNVVLDDESGGVTMGVTIYLISGNFETGGNGEVRLFAPPTDGTYTGPAIPGVLIYLAYGNTGLVKLRGNSDSIYQGLVYAPSGDIDFEGTASSLGVYATQFIGYNVRIGGTVPVDLFFDASKLPSKPATLDLYK